MKMYGSVINRLMENGSQEYIPSIGDGATELMWSDRRAYTITKVINAKTVEVTKDDYSWGGVGGREMGDNSKWVFAPNPDGPVVTLTKRKNGKWIIKGESIKGTAFLMGRREMHHDDSF